MMVELYVIGRYPRDIFECCSLGVKDDDHVYLTAGGRWSRDMEKCICFVTEKAATIHLRRLPWKKREISEVIPVGVDRP